ncbi:MAG: DUF4845 domain-containing protein [Gammaproteobacteria bacterium]|jgi:Domain of unknown function (DUF4845)
MEYHQRQQGITALGLVLWLIILAIGALLTLRLFPIYMESFKIDTAMQSVVDDPAVAEKSNRELVEALLRRFDVDDVQRIDSRNYRNHVKIEKKHGKVAIMVTYRAEAPLFRNLSLVADFRKQTQN